MTHFSNTECDIFYRRIFAHMWNFIVKTNYVFLQMYGTFVEISRQQGMYVKNLPAITFSGTHGMTLCDMTTHTSNFPPKISRGQCTSEPTCNVIETIEMCTTMLT